MPKGKMEEGMEAHKEKQREPGHKATLEVRPESEEAGPDRASVAVQLPSSLEDHHCHSKPGAATASSRASALPRWSGVGARLKLGSAGRPGILPSSAASTPLLSPRVSSLGVAPWRGMTGRFINS